MRGAWVLGLSLMVLPAAACRPRGVQATADLDHSTGEFVSRELGVKLKIPRGWVPRSSEDYVLLMSPAGKNAPSISLDVPDLPAHVPGWIPLNLVKDGYLDDLKKQWHGAKVQEDHAVDVPEAKARRVRTLSGDGAQEETAVLMVHGDRVYILRGTGAAGDEGLQQQFDDVLSSIRWR